MVLSVDEKSQVQALDRTQPGLPMKKGRAGTMTDALYGGVPATPIGGSVHRQKSANCLIERRNG